MTSFVISWLAWQAFVHNMLADGDEADPANDTFMLTKTLNATAAKAELAGFYNSTVSFGLTYDNDTQRWRSNSAQQLWRKAARSPQAKKVKRVTLPSNKPLYKWTKQVDLSKASQAVQNWQEKARAIVATISDKAMEKAFELKNVRALSAHKLAQIMCIILTQKAPCLDVMSSLKDHLRQPAKLREILETFPNGTSKSIDLVLNIKNNSNMIKKQELDKVSPCFKLFDDYVDVWLIAQVELQR